MLHIADESGDMEFDLSAMDNDQLIDRFSFSHLGLVEKGSPNKITGITKEVSNDQFRKKVLM